MRQIWTERPFMNKQKRYVVTRVRISETIQTLPGLYATFCDEESALGLRPSVKYIIICIHTLTTLFS